MRRQRRLEEIKPICSFLIPRKKMSQLTELIDAYIMWRGENKFFCKGKVMTGPDTRRTVITFFLINLPAILFYAFPGAYFLSDPNNFVLGPLAVLLHLTSNYFFLRAVFTNPGYIF
jgi:hypothetical protein